MCVISTNTTRDLDRSSATIARSFAYDSGHEEAQVDQEAQLEQEAAASERLLGTRELDLPKLAHWLYRWLSDHIMFEDRSLS